MYSLIPTIVAILFLVFGLYVIKTKGVSRVTIAFLILCTSTFFWQMAWAVLFQIQDKELAIGVITIGWMLILFLPTSLYHFLIEITGRYSDLKFVYISYVVATLLMVLLITSNTVIDGYHEYFFGYYPKAGILHPIHLLQTSIVVLRGLFITYKKQQIVQAEEKTKLNYCVIGLLIYFFAAIDYLCNYGVEFYPPGVIFILISLAIITLATTRHHVMENSRIIASSIAHEMRTPLATIRSQATILSNHLPELIRGYQENAPSRTKGSLPDSVLNGLIRLSDSMEAEARSINQGVNMLLALSSYEYLNKSDFHVFSINECLQQSIQRCDELYNVNDNITLHTHADFKLFASSEFLTFVIINLIKNAQDAIQQKGSGVIDIHIYSEESQNRIEMIDTGTGIAPEIIPHIFDKFFTTKKRGLNSGIGLAFCNAVIRSFDGNITCESKEGEHTKFILSF
jgi:signal transduction histidine kinase